MPFGIVELLKRLASETRLRGELGELAEAAVPGLETGGWGNWPILTVLRIVCGAGSPDFPFLIVGSSGVDAVAVAFGMAEGREGVLRREGVCGKLFRADFGVGTGGSAEDGGSAVGRESTGRDISIRRTPCPAFCSSRTPGVPLCDAQQKQYDFRLHPQDGFRDIAEALQTLAE